MGSRPLFKKLLSLMSGLLLAACGSGAGSGPVTGGSFARHGLECVPFARALTGIELSGDAPDWWAEAADRYDRTQTPRTGAILAFRRSARLPHGHVSVVSRLLDGREIMVTQANWVHGRVTQDQPVLDVSPRHDWTEVRVWWEPSHALGTTVYPTYGFILPERRLDHDEIAEGTPHAAAIAVSYHPPSAAPRLRRY